MYIQKYNLHHNLLMGYLGFFDRSFNVYSVLVT